MKKLKNSIFAYLAVVCLSALVFGPLLWILYSVSGQDAFVYGVIIWSIAGIFFWMHIKDKDEEAKS